jgi:excisionase family DNA binding protein
VAQPKYYTTQQIAKMLGVSIPTVVNWVKQGRLDAHKTPGGHRRIGREALERFAAVYAYPLPGASPEAQASGAHRILVVDGERDFGELVGEYLQLKAGYEVRTASEPLSAGFLLGRFRPHLVLLDLELGQVAYGDIDHLIKTHLTEDTVHIVGTATFLDSQPVDRLKSLGLDKVVEKPVKLDELLATIRGVLG